MDDKARSTRLVNVFCETTNGAEDLIAALGFARERPWAPLPPGANVATYEQQRYSEEETNEMILVFLKRAASEGYSTPGSILIP
jgi:hypothetical protein